MSGWRDSAKVLGQVLAWWAGCQLKKKELDLPGGRRFFRTTRITVRNEGGRVQRIAGVRPDLMGSTRTQNDLRRLNRELKLLSACGRAVIQAADETDLLKEICRQIVDVGGYLMCWVGRLIPDVHGGVTPIATAGGAEAYLADAAITCAGAGHDPGMVGDAVRSGRVRVERDIPRHPAWLARREIARRYGLRAAIALPFSLGPKASAVLNIFSAQAHAFGADEVLLLEELASNLAFGIASLRERTERQRAELELRISEQKYRTLAENSPSVIMRYDRECRRTYVNHVYIKEILAPMDDVLWVAPGSGWRASMPVEEYLAVLRKVMDSGESAQILLEWPRLIDGQAMSLAIHVVPEYDLDGRVSGLLAIGHDVTALKQTERQLQESLRLLQELMTQREIALEAERKHIAQEIHDELGQHLTSLRMGISGLRFQFSAQIPALVERAQGLIALADKAIQVVRDVASTLRPSVIDAGIVSALEWQLTEFASHTGIATHLVIEENDVPLNDMRATALFRIVQESLTNVARHAAARQVNVVLRRQGDDYVLEVRDDGCGFDSRVPAWTSLGMLGMRERALRLGGELVVVSLPEQGTTIQIRFPVQEKENRDDSSAHCG